MIMCASRSLYISYFPLINPKKIAAEHAYIQLFARIRLFICDGYRGGSRARAPAREQNTLGGIFETGDIPPNTQSA